MNLPNFRKLFALALAWAAASLLGCFALAADDPRGSGDSIPPLAPTPPEAGSGNAAGGMWTGDDADAPDDAGTDEGASSPPDAAVDGNDVGDADDSAAPVFPSTWSVIYGSAIDVGVGPTDDDIWILGAGRTQDSEGVENVALEWSADAGSFQPTTVAGLAIDVTSLGPCVTKADNTIWVSGDAGAARTQLTGGLAQDIGAGPSAVWVISNDSNGGGDDAGNHGVWVWNNDFDVNPFSKAAAYGLRVDVAPDGSAWLVTVDGISHATLSTEETVPIDGRPIDVGVGADGTVYALATDPSEKVQLFEYSPSAGRFEAVLPIDGTSVSAGPSRVVVVLRDGRVVRSP